MGILDSVKDSLGGGSDSSSGFESEEYDSSFDQKQGAQGGEPPAPPQGDSLNRDSGRGGEARDPTPPSPFESDGPQGSSGPAEQPPGGSSSPPPAQGNQPGNQQLSPPGSQARQGRQQGGTGSQPNSPQPGDSINRDVQPNAQAGRPEQGGSSPQVSQETRQKMEQAGFEMDGQQRNDTGAAAGSNADMEEIKSQNEQIIDLLKRIEEQLGQDSVRGRSSTGRSRHGGRR